MAGKKETDADDIEMEQMSKTELARLQRQHRIMEGDREAYSEEMRILLQKQRKTIEILKKEKVELIHKLNDFERLSKEKKTGKMSEILKKLLLRHDQLQIDLNREKSQSKEFDLQIRKVEKELDSIKVKSKGKMANYEETEGCKGIQQQLENRLDVITVKLNRLTTTNKHLRSNIDHFLKERCLYHKSRKELEARFEKGKKAIMDLMEQSTSVYDQREEAQGRLEGLKQKNKQDLVVHGQEIKELQRKLNYDSKLEEFLAVKGQKRIAADLEAKEAIKKQEQKQGLEEKIEVYRSLLEKIRATSGETDVDKLSAQFLKQEEENFALFNYVNELNNEVESVQERLNEIEKTVEEQRLLNEQKLLNKQAVEKTLKSDLVQNQYETLKIQEKRDQCEKTENFILEKLGALFRLVDFSDNNLLRLLENDVEVTPFNYSLCLTVVEKGVSKFRILYDEWKIMGNR